MEVPAPTSRSRVAQGAWSTTASAVPMAGATGRGEMHLVVSQLGALQGHAEVHPAGGGPRTGWRRRDRAGGKFRDAGAGLRVGAGHRAPRMSAILRPASVGFSTTCTPAADRASILAWAVPLDPEMMAPAWPIFLPGGAVTPAM